MCILINLLCEQCLTISNISNNSNVKITRVFVSWGKSLRKNRTQNLVGTPNLTKREKKEKKKKASV